jgi:hypothetical protein
MKSILLFFFFFFTLFANDKAHTFAPSEDCKACHPLIYEEFKGSMHANSIPQKDSILNAVWAKHPKNLKAERFECGKCHTPAADNLDAMLSKDKKALPDATNPTHEEGISCAYCHRIQSIEKHAQSNTNIMTNTQKNYFGTLKEHLESPYHGIVSEGNEHMKNGNVCIGCHSHRMNNHNLNVCSTNIDNQMDGANCVSCHMQKVAGSVSNMHERSEHTFHGFAGTHFNSEMLSKYVDISFAKEAKSFFIHIDNQSSHALLLHPLRMAVLKVSVTRDGEKTQLQDEVFVRVLGKDGEPAMPWIADTTLKDTMIQGNEKRSVKYDFSLKKGDTINVVLGWFLVNPKALEKLNLQDEALAKKFHIFKEMHFSL